MAGWLWVLLLVSPRLTYVVVFSRWADRDQDSSGTSGVGRPLALHPRLLNGMVSSGQPSKGTEVESAKPL